MNSFEDLTKRIENGEHVYNTEVSLSLDLGQEVYVVIDRCGSNLMSDQDIISIPSVCYSEKDAWQSIEVALNNFISGEDCDPYFSGLTIIPNPIIQIYPELKTVTVEIPILCGCNGSVISRYHYYRIVKKSITTF